MTTPMQTDAEVAAKLTKTQARRLVNLAELKRHGWQWTSKLGDRRWHTSRATTAVLAERLLVFNRGGLADLTDLGLRVAQHLKQENAK